MSIHNIQDARDALSKLQQKISAYNHAIGVLYLDATTAAPSDTWEGRGKTMGVLSEIVYELTTAKENGELYSWLEAHSEELTPSERRQVEVLKKDYDRTCRIPAEEYVAYQVLLNDAQAVWAESKVSDDFSSFCPYLEKIVSYNRKFASYYDSAKAPYDALLNMYEEGISMEMLDCFFEDLRNTIVPLLKKIQNAEQIDNSFLFGIFPVEQQRVFSDYLMSVLGLDRKHCAIAETEHPYTTNFNNKDVRITTHYHADNFVSSMYSVIHEGGHALYELGADDCYNYTALQGGVSMGIHESQSRFYENMIGRSKPFIHAIYPEIVKEFPNQMQSVTEEKLYKAVNRAEASLIRTEADELTYCLHIMVRYQIEKELIGGTLTAAEVPARWNSLYHDYLGIEVPNDREGCLQDSHWSGGSIGYFPSYALGSAYAAQFYAKMREQLPQMDEDIAKGDLTRITEWLRNNIHQYASLKKPSEILSAVVGNFDGRYYTEYLRNKFSDLYGL